MVNHDADILKALQDFRFKLLDLSKRNRLLNFRNNRFCVRIVDELPTQVFDYLVRNGKSMIFSHLPQLDEREGTEGETINLYPNRLSKEAQRVEAAAAAGIDISDELPGLEEYTEHTEKKHTDNKLQTKLFMSELETRLRHIRSKARSLIEETGRNQLFLAMGFLQWKDREDSEEGYDAPLIMIPVEIERGRLDARTRCYSYKIRYTGEDLIPNLSLAEKLKRDGLILPDFEDKEVVISAGDADNELDPDAYFSTVGKMASNRKGWEVSRKMVLGFFAFSKLLMYHDLNPEHWPNSAILKNQLIRTLLGGTVEPDVSDFSDDQNKKKEFEHLPLVVDADSSQTEAIRRALRPQSIVIQGPPGTGKSQTITNLIACFLDARLSVLFVAEKMAALDVVYRNLEKVDLADFCFELHSYKAKKEEVLVSLKKRSERKFRDAVNLESEMEKLSKAKRFLGEYIETIKTPIGPDQETVFQIFGKVERFREKVEELPEESRSVLLPIDNIDSINSSEIEEAVNYFETLSLIIRDIGIPCESPWYGFSPFDLYHGDDEKVVKILESAKQATQRVVSRFNMLSQQIELSVNALDLQSKQLAAVCELDPSKVPTDPLRELFGQFLLSENEKPWEEFELLKSLVAKHNEKISLASELLCDLEGISRDKLDEIFQLLSDISSRIWDSISLETAGQVGSSCLKLRELLQKFQAMVKIHVEVGYPEPETISKVRRLVKTDSLMRQMPTGITIHNTDMLFTDSIKVIFTEVAEQGQRLKKEREHLGRIFALQDVCPLEELSDIRRVFRLMQGRYFAFLSPKFRRAKRALLKFLHIRLKAKTPRIVEDLERLEQFLRDESSFTSYPKYKETFGSLFEGIDTNWDRLRQIMMWITNLSELVGSTDHAKKLARLPRNVYNNLAGRSKVADILDSIDEQVDVYAEVLKCNNNKKESNLEDIPLEKLLQELNEEGNLLLSIHDLLSPHIQVASATFSEVSQAIDFLIQAKELREEIENKEEIKALLGNHFSGVDTDIYKVTQTIDWLRSLRRLNLHQEFTERLVSADTAKLITLIHQHAQEWKQDLDLIESSVENLGQFGPIDVDTLLGATVEDCLLGELDRKLTLAISNKDHLLQWAEYSRIAKRGREIGLSVLIDKIERGELAPDQAVNVYLHAVYSNLAKKLVRDKPILATFTRAEYESKRGKFAELDRKILKFWQQRIAYNAGRKPVPQGTRGTRVKDLTEMYLLKWEFNKQRKHPSIRSLMKRAGRAIRALKPVFMMSPMSVAQFLEPGKHTFDVVIMDEASQIQPHDALGAIARAEQMIIVGDSKQLPPTTFFETEMNNPEKDDIDETIFNELDASTSILDVCQSTELPVRRLKWHYRSEHESLIAFSNLQWYDDELIVFPSSGSASFRLGILYHYIEGATYGAGINSVEAKYVAQKIIEHARKSPELSLGVGTFNLKQRDLIEDTLTMLMKKDSSAEFSLERLNRAHDGNEPLFIKNLENLQGDERDIIFISCTFGPDKQTKQVYQRFGPINNPNGPRRLNVLFTRAKKRLEVFSSLKSEDIQAGPGADGRLALRRFLRYAETGQLPDYGIETNRPPDSDFEIAVGRALMKKGYKIQPQVGVAGYFVDIGVQHPLHPDEYILGIECDGATYHSTAIARDRDRLREEVLRRRGWRIHRIWSTDWFKNRTVEIWRLNRRLQQLVEEDKHVIREVEELLDVKSSPVPETETRLSDKELRSRITTFCVENILRPKEMQRMDGFLNVELLDILVTFRPTNMSDFRTHVPTDIRANLDNDDVQYIHDIFDIIAQAG